MDVKFEIFVRDLQGRDVRQIIRFLSSALGEEVYKVI
jgi:hypothetical protein